MKRMGRKSKMSRRRKTKRSKKGGTRRNHTAVDGRDDASFSNREIILENVVDDDPRFFRINTNLSSHIIIKNSPTLTRLHFFPTRRGGGKILFTVEKCDALLSISYASISGFKFVDMHITNDLIKQKLLKNTSTTDYCVNYCFENCTFESGSSIYFLSRYLNTLYFFSCTEGIPQFSTMWLSYLIICHCKKVHFPNLNWPNHCQYLQLEENDYINNKVKRQFLDFSIDLREDGLVDIDLFEDDDYADQVGDRILVDFDVDSRYNDWEPPRPSWQPHRPETVKTNLSLNTMLYDFIEGEISLRNYLDVNPMMEDILFLKMNSDYFITDVNRLQVEIGKLGMDNSTIVYECKTANHSLSDSNAIFNKPYFKLADITGSNGIYIPLRQVEHMISNQDCKFWECYASGLDPLISVISLSVKSGKSLVSGSHCQPGQGGSIFYLRKLIVSQEVGRAISPTYSWYYT